MSGHTTYSDLTAAATSCLDRARESIPAPPATGPRTVDHGPGGPGDQVGAAPDLPECLAAHRDLTASLAHLGRVLTTQPQGTAGKSAPRPGSGPDARLIRALDKRAEARDWAQGDPQDQLAAALLHAARMIRAAADLWITHHTPNGVPRSPEASRMRHPSVLGAAIREWRTLVVASAGIAETLTDLDEGAGSDSPGTERDLAALRGYPRPTAAPQPVPTASVNLTVARPGASRGGDALAEIGELAARIRCNAWVMAQSGSAPAMVLANAATIGVLLNRGAATAHRRAADSAMENRDRAEHLEAAGEAARSAEQWATIAVATGPLRSAHPRRSAIQIERLDLVRLLQRVESPSGRSSPAQAARALSRAAGIYSEVAEFHAQALRKAHDRGEIYVAGRALPSAALRRRPDLLQAKLTDRVVVAPSIVIRHLESEYRSLGSMGNQPGRPRTNPAA